MGHSGPKVLFNKSDQSKPQRTLWLSVKKKKAQYVMVKRHGTMEPYGRQTREYLFLQKSECFCDWLVSA